MRYSKLFKQWAAIARGRCYWHQEQGIGRAFRPGELHGYFNDLTGKAAWPGEVDSNGLPLCKLNGRKVHWPSTVLQKGLAHWDLWLNSDCASEGHWQKFRSVAEWALEAQDSRGGWPHPSPLHPHALSLYSCMTQGQGISVLMRAWRQTGAAEYLGAATRAAGVMLSDVSGGGTSVRVGKQLLFEEFPSPKVRPVLNGWIFAIFGLYDYQLGNFNPQFSGALQGTLDALQAHLPNFDCGFWSLYDSGGTIASPFYHRLHIAQLDALSQVDLKNGSDFEYWRDRFSRQLASRLKKSCAVGFKAAQTLCYSPSTPGGFGDIVG